MVIGDRFDTMFETGCTVSSLPDVDGNFLAIDSDGVVCVFHVDMVLP